MDKKTNYSLKVFSITAIISVVLVIILTLVGYDMLEYFNNFKTYHSNYNTIPFFQKFEWITSNGLLNWIAIPFPNVIVPFVVVIFTVLITALTGVFAYWYLNTNLIRQFVKSNQIAMICSIVYASAGVILRDYYEFILFLPLLLLLIEKFITDDIRFLLSITVLTCSVLQYNLLKEQVIICVIYCIIRVILIGKNFNMKKDSIKVGLFLLEIILGILLAGCFIYPQFNMSDKSFQETVPSMKNGAGTEINLESSLTGFHCTLETNEVETLVINLPYKTDVLVMINERVAELIDFDNRSFKVKTYTGVNEISVTYQPIGFMFGVKLSAVGFIFFVFYIYATVRIVKIIDLNTNPHKRKKGNLIDLKNMTQEELNKYAKMNNNDK